MQTMNVYFDVPTKRCVVLLEVNVSNYSANETQKGLTFMMGAEAIAIDASTYHKLKKKYGD